MKKLIIVLFLLLGSFAAMGQQAVRKELYRSGDLRLNAYYFAESEEYLFMLHASFSTEIDLGDGSFDTKVEIFSGNEREAKSFFEALSLFNRNSTDDETAALRIGNIIIQRERSLTGLYNEVVLPDGRFVQLGKRSSRRLYEAFQKYCESQGIN